MPTSVYLVRHGAYDHRPSREGTEATCDFGLSALGLRQVEALRDRLARTQEIRAEALLCSTLPRARQTADMLAPVLGVEPRAVAGLCEWESGSEAMGDDAFMEHFRRLAPAERRHHRFVAGRETIVEFTERVQGTLREIQTLHEDRTVVLVVHGGTVQAAFSHFLGFGPGPYEGGHPAAAHASLSLWRRARRDAPWTQEFANDTHHLLDVG